MCVPMTLTSPPPVQNRTKPIHGFFIDSSASRSTSLPTFLPTRATGENTHQASPIRASAYFPHIPTQQKSGKRECPFSDAPAAKNQLKDVAKEPMMHWKTAPTTLTSILCMSIIAATAALADNHGTNSDAASNKTLNSVLAAQPNDIKARYDARHPVATMTFCEINEGDTVIETLPGGGWYSSILYPYLGETGKLIGAHYPRALFERFGWDETRLQSVLDRNKNWPAKTKSNAVAKGGVIDSYTMTKMPNTYHGVADKVLFIRSLHNLRRFEGTGYLESSLKEAFLSLKPGGLVCVVQHRAQESVPDAWATGSKGYLKQSTVIDAFEAAGFKFVGASEINANPKDRPSENEVVWRLPPTLRGPEENSKAWQANKEIGESDRMTLKFIKPAS